MFPKIAGSLDGTLSRSSRSGHGAGGLSRTSATAHAHP